MTDENGCFTEETPVRCPVCGWTGLFKDVDEVPCPGGMTHRCPACKSRESRGQLVKTHEGDIDRDDTTQASLGDIGG